jgi:hypothetical protein|tara:strand:- start:3042 stop:3503 length:462 start_codon:yes stop_codon:yes gene_type:complete
MTLTTLSEERTNLGRNVAPDPWQHFGESGSKAADASWTNPVAIDMTQYTSLMMRMNFTGALAATELQFSLSYGAAAADRLVQFMDDDGSIADFTLIPSVSAIGANDSCVIQLGNPVLPLTGIDQLFVSIKNKNSGAIVATSIEYCRVGFKPQG